MYINLKELFHRLYLVISLFINLRYNYRVEIEDYFSGTWDSSVLNYFYFNNFASAQRFIQEYKKQYYIIRLFKQEKAGFALCNIDTGQLATDQDEDGIDYQVDKFGFSMPVELSAGWYRRGLRTHHPIFASIQNDLLYLHKETLRRYIDSKCTVPLEIVIRELFHERHPDTPKYFEINLKNMIIKEMEKEARKQGRNATIR
jgi:hypothetical protein